MVVAGKVCHLQLHSSAVARSGFELVPGLCIEIALGLEVDSEARARLQAGIESTGTSRRDTKLLLQSRFISSIVHVLARLIILCTTPCLESLFRAGMARASSC